MKQELHWRVQWFGVKMVGKFKEFINKWRVKESRSNSEFALKFTNPWWRHISSRHKFLVFGDGNKAPRRGIIKLKPKWLNKIWLSSLFDGFPSSPPRSPIIISYSSSSSSKSIRHITRDDDYKTVLSARHPAAGYRLSAPAECLACRQGWWV